MVLRLVNIMEEMETIGNGGAPADSRLALRELPTAWASHHFPGRSELSDSDCSAFFSEESAA